MRIKVNSPIQLPTKDKTILRTGIHDVPETLIQHWFIQGKIAQGVIEIISKQPVQKVLPRLNIQARVVELNSNLVAKDLTPKEESPKIIEIKAEPIIEEIKAESVAKEEPVTPVVEEIKAESGKDSVKGGDKAIKRRRKK